MSQKKCKRCGAYYEYSVTSNGYSEKYCTFSCESYDRIDELKLTVEEKVNTLNQLKAGITDVIDDYRGPLTGEDATEIIDRLERILLVS